MDRYSEFCKVCSCSTLTGVVINASRQLISVLNSFFPTSIYQTFLKWGRSLLTGEMASSWAKVSLGWMLGNSSLQKGWLNTEIGSPGRWLSHQPWMCLKSIWMWCSGTWFSRGLLELGSKVRLQLDLMIFEALYNLSNSMILWFYDSEQNSLLCVRTVLGAFDSLDAGLDLSTSFFY